MTGKLILVPIKEPKEGMKVVVLNQIHTLRRIHTPETSSLPTCSVYNDTNHKGGLQCMIDELQQIAVEYYEDASYIADRPHVFPKATMLIEKIAKKSILLSPDDYKKALPLIGQEVEWEKRNIGMPDDAWDAVKLTCPIEGTETYWRTVAKLNTPSPIVYTEAEVFGLLSWFDAEHKASNDFMDWWDKHKKK